MEKEDVDPLWRGLEPVWPGATKVRPFASVAVAPKVAPRSLLPGSVVQNAGSSPASGKAAIKAIIARQVSEMVGGDEVEGDTPLMAAGVNSTLAVQLVSSLEDFIGIELPGTLIFDYPSINEVTDFVAELVDAAKGSNGLAAPLNAEALAPAPLLDQERPVVVITASSHTVPGGDLSHRPAHGNDRITLVPLERWDVDSPPPDNPAELNLQFGSFLSDVASFDPAMFGISPAEALLMDPQQRLVLGAFSQALSGHLAYRESVRDAGVFVGVSQLDYARTSYETGSALNTYYATGSHLSVTSGRLAYTHGFKGPALTVDTACSSSLVTTHLASRALQDGECRIAGSVGVNLTLVHSWTRACLRAGMLAEDGRCKTLDASAGK